MNEQCGGPFRTHWQRHHLVENHIDAWNYRQGGTVAGQRGTLPADDIAADDTYTDIGVSALGFAVALDPDHSIQHNIDNAQQYGWTQTPDGWARPANLPDDPSAAKDAIDVDGNLPDWLAGGIVRALIATYHDGGPEPQNLGGSPFQATAATVLSGLESLLNDAGISINQPLDQLVAQVAPAPGFEVPPGYPLPWEVQVSHRFMITYYKFAFWSSFNLDKPRRPSVIIWPPASDFTNLASAPDMSGVSGSDPAEDFCDAILAILKWLVKEGEAVGQLVGDIIKALASPGTYPIRWALYQLAMSGWDMVSTAHDILAHVGFMLPHGALTYSDNGEQRWTNEIDNGLISLGSTLDGSFAQALMDAIDPFGNLDSDPSLLVPPHNPRDKTYPYLPVRDVQLPSGSVIEFHRPWDYPTQCGPETALYPNVGETSDIRCEVDYVGRGADLGGILQAGVPPQAGTTSGPFPQGATPDQVFYRTGRPVSPQERAQYEQAPSPAHTDAINMRLIGTEPGTDHSPLGDPLPFIGYLMGRVLSPHYDYQADFNLDADRGYGYRCWDWIRGTETGQDQRGQTYLLPQVPPEGAEATTFTPAPPQQWHGAPPAVPTEQPIQLHYLPGERGTVDQ